MSDHENEQTPTPPEGEQAPPSVDPLAPPDPGEQSFEPVGQTDQAAQGEPAPEKSYSGNALDAADDPNLGHALEDQASGVGVAPTQPGDAGEGNPGTEFQTTEQVEAADGEPDGDVRDHI